MNNQLYFYPPYPYMEESGYFDFDVSETRSDSKLYTPIETLQYGNAFKNEYRSYKKYLSKKIEYHNDIDKYKIELMAYYDICHDLKLYLDIYPNDKEVLDLYVKMLKEMENARSKYEATSNKLFPESVRIDEGRYNYAFTPSPWMEQ